MSTKSARVPNFIETGGVHNNVHTHVMDSTLTYLYISPQLLEKSKSFSPEKKPYQSEFPCFLHSHRVKWHSYRWRGVLISFEDFASFSRNLKQSTIARSAPERCFNGAQEVNRQTDRSISVWNLIYGSLQFFSRYGKWTLYWYAGSIIRAECIYDNDITGKERNTVFFLFAVQ